MAKLYTEYGNEKMIALRSHVAKKPSSLPVKKGNQLVKIDPELVEMIGWLVYMRNRYRQEGQKEWAAADIVEPLIRPTVKRDYEVIKAEVESIKRDEARAAKRLQDHDAKEGQER